MDIFKKFRRDDDRIVSGAPYVVGEENGEKVVIKVARAHDSNPAFTKRAQEITEQHQSQIDALKKDKDAQSKLRSDLALQAFVDTCIKGWSGLTNEDGTVFEYSEENVQKLHDVPELVEKLFLFAVDDANYLGSFDEEASLKN